MGMLDGKTAMVTGAARGIGRSIAQELARCGADLAIADLDAAWLEETAASIKDAGRRVVCLSMDVGSSEDVTSAVGEAVKELGGLDIMVNNAGITKDGLLMRMSDADWDAVLNVNLRGAFLCTRAVARPMMKKKSGVIINIASIIGLIGNAGQCNYSASKAGVIALTKSSAKELASRNIRVNAIAPGFIQSKMTDALSDEVRASMLDAIPMKRFGTPEDVAQVVAFLASDASAYMTGQVLTVSGGMVM